MGKSKKRQKVKVKSKEYGVRSKECSFRVDFRLSIIAEWLGELIIKS